MLRQRGIETRDAKAKRGELRFNLPPRYGWDELGHPDVGWRSAVISSITGTCKLLKVNPADYLTWVLPRLVTATSAQTDGLLPHDYAAAVAAP